MEKIKITEEWLKENVSKVDLELLNELENQEIPEHKFSRRFERKMKKLIKMESHSPAYSKFAAAGRRAAVFLLVCFLSGSALFIGADANRYKGFEKVDTYYDTHIERRYMIDKRNAGELVIQYPEYIPAGYKEELREETEERAVRIYKNENGNDIIYSMTLLNSSSVKTINSKIKTKETVKAGGKEIEVFEFTNGYKLLLWYADTTGFSIQGNKTTDKEDLIKMAESAK